MSSPSPESSISVAALAAYTAKVIPGTMVNSRSFREHDDKDDLGGKLLHKDFLGKIVLHDDPSIVSYTNWCNELADGHLRINLLKVIQESNLFLAVFDNSFRCSKCVSKPATGSHKAGYKKGRVCILPIKFGYSVYKHCLKCLQSGDQCSSLHEISFVPRNKVALPAKKATKVVSPIENVCVFLSQVLKERKDDLSGKLLDPTSSIESESSLRFRIDEAQKALEAALMVLDELSDSRITGAVPSTSATIVPPTPEERMEAAMAKISGSLAAHKRKRGGE